MNIESSKFTLPFLTVELWEVLVMIILLLVLGSILFFVATLLKRIKKIEQEKSKKSFQKEIDLVLFQIMFGEDSDIQNKTPFTLSNKSQLYKKVLIKSLIGLHSNFRGVYNSKLEEFFIQTELVNFSLKKLASKRWEDVVVGMRDLSDLNYQPAYELILQVKFQDNDVVQQEKLIARIKLKGLSELWEFRESKIYLNDWTQSNILYTVKNHKVEPVEDLPELLHSKNESVALLGIRLIHYYQKLINLEILDQFRLNTKSQKLIDEINFLMRKKSFNT